MKPIMEFDSHIAGKNAVVRLWPDRVEWSRTGWLSTAAKVTAGVATVGVSLLATGVRGKSESNVILVRSIASVATKKSGLTKMVVEVSTPAGTVSFRCSPSEAKRFQEELLQQIASTGS